MMLSEEDLKVLAEVPAGKWHEVMDFARYLTEEHKKKIDSGKKREKPRLWGALEGEIWMSDDFNEPLELVPEGELRPNTFELEKICIDEDIQNSISD